MGIVLGRFYEYKVTKDFAPSAQSAPATPENNGNQVARSACISLNVEDMNTRMVWDDEIGLLAIILRGFNRSKLLNKFLNSPYHRKKE